MHTDSYGAVVKLREKVIGLPLQRSVFDRLHTAGTIIGMENSLRDGRFHAALDSEGSLHVDKADVEAIAAAFPTRPDDSFLAGIETKRRERCAALVRATSRARETATTGDVVEARVAASDLLDRLVDFAPYPLLTKIVPDLLQRALLAQGAAVPAAPSPSAGFRLTQALEELASWCWAHTASVADLGNDWPDVQAEVHDAVCRFCGTHAGFGPVAWEAPGFDSPRYTLVAVASLGPVDGIPDVTARPSFSDISFIHATGQATLSSALEGWLELTDLQIWFLRSAFYLGLAPLLVLLGTGLDLAAERLLFVTRHELRGTLPSRGEIESRVAAYLADTGYLERNSVGAGRLLSLFEDVSCRTP